jgi:cardiolipin synthase
MDSYALRVGGAPASEGNEVEIYRDGVEAFEAKFAAIRAAAHHIHLEYFILHDDGTGRALIDLLCEKARKGVEVRLLVDAIGSRGVHRLLEKLRQAGGQVAFFLPPRFYKPRFTIGLRNHRKILICDGRVGFMGGLNIGDEYLGKVPFFGYWRDTHLQIGGPAVLALQRVFVEDWDFAFDELLTGNTCFPKPVQPGDVRLQIVWSGPDQENNASREIYFAAFTAARRKLWISTPYLVPDSALLAGLRSAALRGVDVRILTQSYPPDHWLPYWAGRYFWEDLMSCGVRIFEYRKGMLHAKVLLADDAWASVGSSNLDIRSIRLNFEINCHIHTQRVVSRLEEMFLQDLGNAREVNLGRFRHRSWRGRLAENVCRLFSPLL